jgi:hypothetical protein
MYGEPLLSVVIAIYNSHEIVRRQALWLARMGLDADVEFIFVDDGSRPALDVRDYRLPGLRVLHTGNQLAWTQGLARNLGAEAARGELLLMTDIDHILSRAAIEAACNYQGPKMIFRRQIGILDAQGALRQERATLAEWGYVGERLDASVHGNTWAMPRRDFLALGGYDRATCERGYHPASRQGDDCYFNAKWNKAHRGETLHTGPDIYLFPLGRFNVNGALNPFGLFHDLHQRAERAQKGDELVPGAFPVSSLGSEASYE